MLQHRISGLPVVDGEGRLVGLLTENDLVLGSAPGLPIHLQLLEDLLDAKEPTRHLDQIQEIGEKRVKELMTREIVTAQPDAPLGS